MDVMLVESSPTLLVFIAVVALVDPAHSGLVRYWGIGSGGLYGVIRHLPLFDRPPTRGPYHLRPNRILRSQKHCYRSSKLKVKQPRSPPKGPINARVRHPVHNPINLLPHVLLFLEPMDYPAEPKVGTHTS